MKLNRKQLRNLILDEAAKLNEEFTVTGVSAEKALEDMYEIIFTFIRTCVCVYIYIYIYTYI